MHIKKLQPIGDVNNAHCTGHFAYTNFESTNQLLASDFPRRVARWSSTGDRAFRQRLPLEQSASLSLLSTELSAQSALSIAVRRQMWCTLTVVLTTNSR